MLKDKIDPRVLDLVQSLNIKIVTYQDCADDPLYRGSLPEWTAGMCCHLTDRILVNLTPPEEFNDMNEVVLHELVHWTGAIKRLCRPAICLREKEMAFFVDAYTNDTEEHIAQWGMFILANQLGLNYQDYLSKVTTYLKYFPNGHKETGKREAEKAVYFINGLLAAKAA